MNKTISVNISGQNFLIEESAHFMLQNYLDEIRKHCGHNTDVKEVMDDIESGIAEKLKSLITQYKEVITAEDIESLIKVMGTAEDFDREVGETSEETEEDPKIKRKLYRDTDNAVIAGVASGLANYFDIDPVIFRVLFFISMFMSGFGVLVYIVLWIAMPEAKTAHQKLEMCGQAPTIAAFEKLSKMGKDSKEKYKNRWKNSSGFKKVFSAPFIVLNNLMNALKRIISKLWPMVKFLFGLGLIIFSLIALAGIGIGSLYLLLQTQTNYLLNFVPISELIQVIPFTLLVAGLFFSLAIPTALLLFGGLTIIRKNNMLTFNIVAILIAVWMIIGILCCAFGLRYVPDVVNKVESYPILQIATKEIDISEITKLTASGRNISIEVVPGTNEKAVLTGRQVDLDIIDVKNENGELNLSEKDAENTLCIDCRYQSVKLTVSGDKLTEIKAENRAFVNIAENFLNEPVLTADNYAHISWQDAKISKLTAISNDQSTIDVYGTISDAILTTNNGDINLDSLGGNTAKVDLNGSNSRVNLSGKVDNLFVVNKSSGEGNILNCVDLQNKITAIDATGKIMVIAGKTDQINLNQSTNVNLFYTGEPKLTGESDSFRILNYQKVNRAEFIREEEQLGTQSMYNGEVKTDDKLLIRTGENFFILNRGKLSESDFEDLFEIFQSTIY